MIIYILWSCWLPDGPATADRQRRVKMRLKWFLVFTVVFGLSIGCGIEDDDEKGRRAAPPQQVEDRDDDGTDDGREDVGCLAFTLVVDPGCSVSQVSFWSATGKDPISFFSPSSQMNARGFERNSALEACSVTLDWPGRWETWENDRRNFPGPNAPTGHCVLAGGINVPFGELNEGEAAYGCAHDGRTKDGVVVNPCADGGCYAAALR